MDTFNLYVDCPSLFECSVGLDGVSYRDATARIVTVTSGINLLFDGTITGQGDCSVPIPAVAGIYDEGVTGLIRLEVIADGYYFDAFDMPFTVSVSKKVTVTAPNQADVVEETPVVRVDEPVIDAVVDPVVEAAPNVEPEPDVEAPKRKVTIKRKEQRQSAEMIAIQLMKAFKK